MVLATSGSSYESLWLLVLILLFFAVPTVLLAGTFVSWLVSNVMFGFRQPAGTLFKRWAVCCALTAFVSAVLIFVYAYRLEVQRKEFLRGARQQAPAPLPGPIDEPPERGGPLRDE